MHNPFVHVELNTDDVPAAQKFYKALFNWTYRDMGMGYTGIDVGEGVGGGMQKKVMPGSPTMWLPYILVDDVRKTTAKAAKLGAHVMVDYMPVDGMGALGVFVDPTGAPIGVWEAVEMGAKAETKTAKKAAAKKAPAKKAPAKKATAKKATAKKRTR